MRFLQFLTSKEIRFEQLPSIENPPNSDEGTVYLNQTRRKYHFASWWPHLVLFTFNIFLFLFIVLKDQTDQYTISPANDAISYEDVYYNASLIIKSPFTGKPRAELDHAWSDLLQYSSIIVSEADLKNVNKTSIPIPGMDDAYWVDLSVTHELHCIKRLYQYFHKETYFASLSPEDEELNFMHTDHCLEILRQAAMCHADTSLIPMRWSAHSPVPEADFSVPHKCVNWEKLRMWTRDHSIDVMKPGFLQHPTLGPAFPDGSNKGIGVEHNHTHGN